MARTQTETKLLNFVDIKTVWTPASEQDYAVLRALGIPITWVGPDQQPLLTQLCRKYGIELTHEKFSDVEKALIVRIQERWRYDFSTAGKELVFSFPSNSVAANKHWSGLFEALTPWYARYHIRLELQTRTRKRGTLTVHTLARHFENYLVF